jgi:predicted lipoprotein with Yx(FWY)xxD motif
MKRLFIPAGLVVAVAALVIALTSGGTSTAHNSAQAGSGPYGGTLLKQSPPAAGSVIGVRSTTLGKVLVDGKGRTLYLFEADRPNVSRLSAAGHAIWPLFTSQGKPQADGGAIAAKIGTIATTRGKRQVTYNGHPLYYYVGDQKPGDTAGQGLKQFGAAWYVLAATGNKIDND